MWHSAGTGDVATKTRGPFETMKHPEKPAPVVNNGLEMAVRFLEEIKEQFLSSLTLAFISLQVLSL